MQDGCVTLRGLAIPLTGCLSDPRGHTRAGISETVQGWANLGPHPTASDHVDVYHVLLMARWDPRFIAGLGDGMGATAVGGVLRWGEDLCAILMRDVVKQYIFLLFVLRVSPTYISHLLVYY
ncbi:hypothetical protein HETIRDRAFT_310850 [Heterobasidion irregulare TC 32-1]|uniref:Uncharacterized protein n=1 Tax=Heterobasidion irregulare (strain TC 32-1) TaxID=747525 RepID=W4KIT6_HETIT|nr:uncharacterized protein HETIRDRAFT_310850 [Heterobasidion irregulare TC 32-1]ETW85757.1 hypothetical protein HETIRDRAFT_310850 [Heterobasidion irregulare TC 32-1]